MLDRPEGDEADEPGAADERRVIHRHGRIVGVEPPGYDAGAGFLNYDLRQGLPEIADGSVEVFFSSHFFEHVNPQEAMNLMQACRRALRDDGMARFQMPDFKQTFRAYVDDDQAFLDKALGLGKVVHDYLR